MIRETLFFHKEHSRQFCIGILRNRHFVRDDHNRGVLVTCRHVHCVKTCGPVFLLESKTGSRAAPRFVKLTCRSRSDVYAHPSGDFKLPTPQTMRCHICSRNNSHRQSGVFRSCSPLSPVESLSLRSSRSSQLLSTLEEPAMQAEKQDTRQRKRSRDWQPAAHHLLNEQCLAQLVAPDKGFHGAEMPKQILDFPVLVDTLGWTQRRARNEL
jgi:hypothetical protein